MARLGILGGTFNPPHVGHLVLAQEAIDQLGLDRVVLMPVSSPPHKDVSADPGPEVRLDLCRRAVAADDRLDACDLEVARAGRSFTVDTLRELHDLRPDHALTFIVGGDVADGLPTWREPAAVLTLARMAIAEREGIRRDDLARRLEPFGAPDRIAFLDMPRIDISSSAIRRRVAEGRPVRYLVPDAVADAIEQHGLYRAAAEAAR